MSIAVPFQEIEMPKLVKELHIYGKPKNNRVQDRYRNWKMIQAYHIENEIYKVPFAWAMKDYGKYRTERGQCAPMNATFSGQLRDSQSIVEKETIQCLNRQAGSCLMAMYPGAGKCLGKGTWVRLYDKTEKRVEEITTKDVLMGDDGKARQVWTLSRRGKEIMYRIQCAVDGLEDLDYVVNASHVMTVYDRYQHVIVDLDLEKLFENCDCYYGVCIVGEGPLCEMHVMEMKQEILKPSVSILDCPFLSKRLMDRKFWQLDRQDQWTFYQRECILKEFPYRLTDATVEHQKRIRQWGLYPVKMKNGEIHVWNPFSISEQSKKCILYYPLQREKLGKDEYYGFTLSDNGRFLLGNGVVTHNTVTSISVSCKIKLKTMILVHRIMLLEQWADSIRKNVCEDAYQIIYPKSEIDVEKDFFIINAANVCKYPREVWKRLKIGTVIVDECHLMMTKAFVEALTFFTPRYLIGLSATPYRPDGFDALLSLYFGSERILRELKCPHHVFKIETGMEWENVTNEKGEIIWNSILTQQMMNEERNRWIVDCCTELQNRCILILCKRVRQIQILAKLLRQCGEHVATLKENDTEFDTSARILIASIQKVGTGFSFDRLDALILACDTEEYFLQYLGRVFRRPEVCPIIIDIVDKHPILERHFSTRKKVYIQSLGRITKCRMKDWKYYEESRSRDQIMSCS